MLVRDYKDVIPVPYGQGIEKRVAIGPKQGAPTFVMRVFDIPPGTSTPFHSHDWEHEVFVLAGEGAVVGDEGETPLKAEDVIFVPAGEKHYFTNRGQDIFRFICVVPLRGEDTP